MENGEKYSQNVNGEWRMEKNIARRNIVLLKVAQNSIPV